MSWSIAGIETDVRSDLELTPQTLSLTIETTDLDQWLGIGDRAGDVQTETGFGGRFRTIDRSGRAPVMVKPPAELSPPFAPSEFHVVGFEVSPLSETRSEVSLELQRPTPRDDVFAFADEALVPSQSGFGRNFGADFGAGDVDLAVFIGLRSGAAGSVGLEPRQVGRATETEGPMGAEYELPVVLTDKQAAALADAAGVPEAIVERTVPDGASFMTDSAGGRQTVVVDAQRDDLDPPSGTYGVAGWTVTEQQPSGTRRWRVSLSLRELSE